MEPTHGTRANYLKGCRCDDCAAANRDYYRKWRAANRDKRRENNRKWREANPDYHREYYEANRSKVRERQRKYSEANRDKITENTRKWCEANRERKRENDRKYYEANRDKVLENVREHRKANPDKARAYGLKAFHVRHARKLAAFVEDVDPQVVFERDGWMCHICGDSIDPTLKDRHPMSASLDHIIPLAKGGEHSYANCGTAHLQCNKRKGAKIPA